MSLAFTRPPDNSGLTSGDTARLVDSEACILWTESTLRSPTVSSKRLTIPSKAVSEYQKGCAAYKNQKLAEAESHLHKAIDDYSDYAAAWVVLGQVLITEKKNDEARSACWKAVGIDPGYAAPYLCLAEFAAKESDWGQVAKLTTQALAIDPTGNPYSLYYAADAALHERRMAEAEVHALAAVRADEWHRIPELHLLLAQVYATNGNVAEEAAQLKEFLRVAATSKDAATVRDTLAKLETTPARADSDPQPPSK